MPRSGGIVKRVDMRFDGITRMYGDEGAARLRQAYVLIVGIGGVGSWVAEALARSGIGGITLADPDEVCVSNINRQIQALDGTVGRMKVEVMAERLRAIAPDCDIRQVPKFINESSIEALFDGPCDYVADAIDGVMPKAGLIARSCQAGIPIVTCGGSGGKCDPSLISVMDLAATYNDRLLAFVRKKLRHVFDFPATGPFGVPCVFSPEPARWPKADESCVPETENPLAEEAGSSLNCDGRLGALTFVTGVFGFHMAAHIVNAIAGVPFVAEAAQHNA